MRRDRIYADNELLNPELYRAILQAFGGPVHVVRPGQHGIWYGSWQRGRRGEIRLAQRPTSAGEEYAVNCPLCGDTRQRLSINHQWGQRDDLTQDSRLWMANCYNEGCFSKFENRVWLHDTLTSLALQFNLGGGTYALPDATPVEEQDRPLTPVTIDAAFQSFSWLRQHYPCHRALMYIESRNFVPEWLEQRWGATYCLHCAQYYGLSERIYIPITMGGQLYGWQGRIPVDIPKGKRKYYNMPDMQREKIIYNIDAIRGQKYVILTEGVVDTWRTEHNAVALLGNKISDQQLTLLCDYLGYDWHAILMLDPTQDEKSRQRGAKHHMVEAREKLWGAMGYDRVHEVWLPQGYDAGGLDQRVVWDRITQSLRDQYCYQGYGGRLPEWFDVSGDVNTRLLATAGC